MLDRFEAPQTTWSMRLEKAAFVMLGLSLFGATGGSSYNVMIAFFVLFSAWTPQGRVNAVAWAVELVSLLIDIIVFSKFGPNWHRAGANFGFGYAMLIMAHLVKYPTLYIFYKLYIEFGDKAGVDVFPGVDGDYRPMAGSFHGGTTAPPSSAPGYSAPSGAASAAVGATPGAAAGGAASYQGFESPTPAHTTDVDPAFGAAPPQYAH